MKLWIAVVVAKLALWAPEVSRACAVCFQGRGDATREAFTITTVFLTLLPLLAIGGAVWWLRRRARELEHARTSREPRRGGKEPLGATRS